MKVALVHDYLFEQGGAENVFEVMAAMFPDAPIYTAIYNPDTVSPLFRQREVHTSFLQRITTDKRKAKALLPFYPAAFERMRLRGYDLVLTSSSSFAKGIDVGGARHVCYCYTPPHFLWQTDRYIEQVRRPALRAVIHLATGVLRERDRRHADNVTDFIAISGLVQRRIQRIYKRDAAVIYPPIDVAEFHLSETVEPYYLVVSRLLPYKRVDIVIEACNRLGLPLVVVGDGPDRARLEAMASPTVTMRGRLPRAEVVEVMARCRALVFPGEEDFGLTPLEAMASGRPVIAYRAGGALETVVEGVTGAFFETQTVDALADVLAGFDASRYRPKDARAHALTFDRPHFKTRLWSALSTPMGTVITSVDQGLTRSASR